MKETPPPKAHNTSTLTRYTHKLYCHIKDPLYRNSLFLIANTAVTSGIGFFFWIVIARYYDKADMGLANAIMSAISLLVLLSPLGLDVALVRFIPKAEKKTEIINSCFLIGGIVSLIAATIFILGVNIWSPTLSFIRSNAVFAAAFVVFTMFATISTLLEAVFITKRRADFVLSKNTVISLLKLVLPFILVSFFRSFGIVSSWGIATCIAVVIYLFLFLPKVQKDYRPTFRINLSVIKNFWKYSAGNYFAGLLASVYGPVLPIIIVNRLGAEENANYFVAWMIAGLLFVIPSSIAHALFAEGSHFENELNILVKRSFKFTLLLLIPAIIILWFFGKWLLLAFGESFTNDALSLLKILTLSAISTGVNAVYYTVLKVEHKIKELIIISAFITVAILAGSYLTMSSFGILGTGYTYLFVQGIISIYALLVMRVKYRRKAKKNETYN